MKALILKIAMSLAFLIAAYVFVSIRLTTPTLLNLLLKEPAIPEHEDFTTYGEHYYNAGLIRHFREDMPVASEKFRLSSKNRPPEEADILIFGDSHFDFSRQATFAERLSDSLNVSVFLERHRSPYDGNILAYLKDIEYKSNRPKWVIYESSERYVIDRSISEYENNGILINQNKTREFLRTLRFKVFNPLSDNLYNTFLKKSYLTIWLYSQVTTFKFNLFQYMNQVIPEYVVDRKNGSWLFHYEPVDYYKRDDITDSLVRHCSRNIQKMQQKLKSSYDLDMVYVIVPEKYTIYNLHNTNIAYHNFIPRLHIELKRLGIPYVDLFTDFKNDQRVLYFKTDTHWNKMGVDIAIDNALPLFRGK